MRGPLFQSDDARNRNPLSSTAIEYPRSRTLFGLVEFRIESKPVSRVRHQKNLSTDEISLLEICDCFNFAFAIPRIELLLLIEE